MARWSADGGAGIGAPDRLDVALAGHAWQILVRPSVAVGARELGGGWRRIANPGGGSVFWFTVTPIGVTVPDKFPELGAA